MTGCRVEGCDRKHGSHGYCKMHAERVRRTGTAGDAKPLRTSSIDERLATYIDTTGGPDACHPWTAGLNADGYGIAWDDRQMTLAHVLLWRHRVGEVPAGHRLDHVCHTLDVSCKLRERCPHRRCANLRHLEVVTVAENVSRSGLSWSRNDGKCHAGLHDITDPQNVSLRPEGRGRLCRPCQAARLAEWREAHRAA